MDINNEINSFIKEQMGLEAYTTKCTSLFEKFIDSYQESQSINSVNNDSKEVAGCMEVMDDLQMRLRFVSSMKHNVSTQSLTPEDRSFFNTPKFLPFQNQVKIGIRIAKKIDELNEAYQQITHHKSNNYFDLTSEVEVVYEKNVESWLSSCWQRTNNAKQVSYPLYYYYHDSMDNSINLLDGKKYNLETLAKKYE